MFPSIPFFHPFLLFYSLASYLLCTFGAHTANDGSAWLPLASEARSPSPAGKIHVGGGQKEAETGGYRKRRPKHQFIINAMHVMFISLADDCGTMQFMPAQLLGHESCI